MSASSSRIAQAVVFVAALVPCGATVAQPKAVGGQMVSRTGFTLYTFDNDVAGAGKSVCNAPCSNIFPPYRVEAGAKPSGDASIITRADGSRQWAYKGRPLYRFFDDKKPAQAGGDGMNHGIWHVARP